MSEEQAVEVAHDLSSATSLALVGDVQHNLAVVVLDAMDNGAVDGDVQVRELWRARRVQLSIRDSLVLHGLDEYVDLFPNPAPHFYRDDSRYRFGSPELVVRYMSSLRHRGEDEFDVLLEGNCWW